MAHQAQAPEGKNLTQCQVFKTGWIQRPLEIAEEVGIDAWNMHEKLAIILGKCLWLNDF